VVACVYGNPCPDLSVLYGFTILSRTGVTELCILVVNYALTLSMMGLSSIVISDPFDSCIQAELGVLIIVGSKLVA
jgi:hypothetical protein